jgi:hypothetical protein
MLFQSQESSRLSGAQTVSQTVLLAKTLQINWLYTEWVNKVGRPVIARLTVWLANQSQASLLMVQQFTVRSVLG